MHTMGIAMSYEEDVAVTAWAGGLKEEVVI